MSTTPQKRKYITTELTTPTSSSIKSSSEKEFKQQMKRVMSESKLVAPENGGVIKIKDIRSYTFLNKHITYINGLPSFDKTTIQLYTSYGSAFNSSPISDCTKKYLLHQHHPDHCDNIVITSTLITSLKDFISLYIDKLSGTASILEDDDNNTYMHKFLARNSEYKKYKIPRISSHPSFKRLVKKLSSCVTNNDSFKIGEDPYIVERVSNAITNPDGRLPCITNKIIKAYTLGGLRILIKRIRLIIQNSPIIDQDGSFTVFRGIKHDYDKFEARGLQHVYPGHIISTSLKLSEALTFSKTKMLYIISVPFRSRFLYLEPISISHGEYEILLPDSTEFKITKYVKNVTLNYDGGEYPDMNVYYLEIIKQ